MPEFPETRYSLIQRVKDLSDGASWAQFLGIYQPVVYRMARRRGLQDADAHDVIQQVFVSVARSIDQWEPEEDGPPFRAWLSTVARNAITKALSRQPRDRASGSSSAMLHLCEQPSVVVATSEIVEEARREIIHWAAEQIRSEFSDVTWDIFWKTSVEGVSVAQVARDTERSVGAIYVARHRVLSRLKAKVKETAEYWDVI